MDKKTRIFAIAAAVAASILIITSPSGSIVIPKPNTNSSGTDAVKVIATNLQKPWALTFGDGKIFFTEKVGRLRVVDNGTLVNDSVADFRVADISDAGLLGVTTHPDFVQNHFMYVYYTYKEGDKLWNKVLRITESNDKIVDAKVILDKIPGAEFDDGGVIKFGPDKKLYIGTGDATDQNAAQDLTSLAGKILRLNDDGSIPSDNPIPNSPIYSLGHRNPQGLTWDDQGNLYETEEGPTKNDEINLIEKDKNYGWPNQECSGSAQYQSALNCYNVSIQPSGIAYYGSGKLDFKNSLILATLRGNILYQLPISNGNITSQKIILDGLGRIREVGVGPDGYLYILTGNTDGQGFPDSKDDKLLRIVQ
ncbi:MAG: PQQ-dependent sugar dehydrogenase [Thaumarchaeota archaeon]|nr:PQQ-dependent sugar dehydrogenase [Nitrososphaerota archaeon]MDE1817610.1 PQQ-dependent sugar dehydrogenase [Nitrososphaerota archaeon]MDE1875637.1 PQQ-dependent sugar dehydrogenase [Nitrososphaerota archaeon]